MPERCNIWSAWSQQDPAEVVHVLPEHELLQPSTPPWPWPPQPQPIYVSTTAT
ncbi:hypothetical protein ACFYXS_05920 [Streptomyces sp. NPDC002574]|uniref:hypothetical protein n=1 Tax=Streptomyces sp. NPDC002574 TaxID=3364652 RepID=UPI0036A19089